MLLTTGCVTLAESPDLHFCSCALNRLSWMTTQVSSSTTGPRVEWSICFDNELMEIQRDDSQCVAWRVGTQMFVSGESCAVQLSPDHTICIVKKWTVAFHCSERVLSFSAILFTILLLGEWPYFSYSVVFLWT